MKKRIISLLLALIMALSLLPVSVLAAGAEAPTPSAENGFVDEIYFPVAAKKSIGNSLERIQGYVFQQGTTKYDVILPDKAVKVVGPPANYFGIKVPEKYIMNSTPFVRQYDILSNKWGVLLCQKEYQTNDIRRNSREWL